MTTAELAALLAGIDLNTARRRVRYSHPGTPLQNSENICANTPARVNVVEGMITLADPLPDDLETAHQLIRELLKSLAQQVHLNDKLQHQLEQLLRQRYGPKTERIDPAQLLLFAREILAQAEPAPAPARHPSRTRRRLLVPPRRTATAASRCRRACPARRSSMTSRPSGAPAPTAAPSAPASARTSANSSNTSPRR